MTWSISGSGKKADAKEAVENSKYFGPECCESRAFDGVKAAMLAMIEGAGDADTMSASASGADKYMSVSFSISTPAPT